MTQQRTFRDFDTFSTFKGPQYAPTPSKTALTTAPTSGDSQVHILKLPAHAQWQHTGSAPGAPGGMLLTVVDDMVVDLGRLSCICRLAAWQQPTEPDVQEFSSFQLPREGFARLAQAQLQHPEHA